jgi:hypothetical protein
LFSFNIFIQLVDGISVNGISINGISADRISVDGISVDGISASYGEGGRRGRKRSVLVVTARLEGAEVELWPLPRRLPLNVARV